MTDNYEERDSALANWQQIEQWFLRILGADLLILAVLSMIFGTLRNIDNEATVMVVNVIITLVFGASGLWTLYSSTRADRLQGMIEKSIERGNSATRALTVMQIIVAILFLLEGLSRGQIVMLLFGVTMIAIAGFYFWRSNQINRYQE